MTVLLTKEKPARKRAGSSYPTQGGRPSAVLSEEGRDLDVFLLRKLPAVWVEPPGGTFGRSGSPGIPVTSGLDGITRGGVVAGVVGLLAQPRMVRGTQPKTHIGGQPLEQRAGIARLSLMSFFRRE